MGSFASNTRRAPQQSDKILRNDWLKGDDSLPIRGLYPRSCKWTKSNESYYIYETRKDRLHARSLQNERASVPASRKKRERERETNGNWRRDSEILMARAIGNNGRAKNKKIIPLEPRASSSFSDRFQL